MADHCIGSAGSVADRLVGSEHDADCSHAVASAIAPRAEALCARASAAMDVSDGLAGDLAKLCRASGVAARIECARVPLSDAARAALAADPALIETIVSGGDDYEVLATAAPHQVEPLRKAAAAAGVALTEIGEVTAGEGEARFIGADGKPLSLARPSFSHF